MNVDCCEGIISGATILVVIVFLSLSVVNRIIVL